MPKIDDITEQRIKDAADIVSIVGDFVTLRKVGVNMTGLCPFHDDKHTGNFIVRPKNVKNSGNSYRCFACGAKGGPVTFLMQHAKMTYPDALRYIAKKESIFIDDVPLNYTPPPPRPVPPPPPTLEIPREWVSGLARRCYPNNFIQWLYTLPWSDSERERLRQTLWQYCVSGWKDGRVTFWQIDHEGHVRCAKLMRYLDNGHRDKQSHPGWIYNQPGIRERLDPDNHTILRPLFGAHLLKAYPQAKVHIVESEKTAIIMANYYGDPAKDVWLACGGLNWLNLDSMQPLIDQQRAVWLWPDKDGIEQWQQVCDKLGADNVNVYSDFFRTHYVEEDDGPKADIADITIRIMGGGRLPERKQDTGDGQGTTLENASAGRRIGVTPAPTPDPSVLGTKPAGMSDGDWQKHCTIMKAIMEHNIVSPNGEPFKDPVLMQDPRARDWRKKLRQSHPNPWFYSDVPTADIASIRTVGEILLEHPLLINLLCHEQTERREARGLQRQDKSCAGRCPR